MKRGKILIISGPSGAGKTTVVKEFLSRVKTPFHCSVSATTRSPRPGEVDGVNYHFITPEQFAAKKAENGFLESVEVFGTGVWYGTPIEEVEPFLNKGEWTLLEIDVRGCELIKQRYGKEVVSVFISPGSMKALEERLRGRKTESEADIAIRLKRAEAEMATADKYDYIVVNDVVAKAADAICHIVEKEI